MKKRFSLPLFIVTISLFILLFLQSSGLTQNIYDTVRVECLEFVPAEATVTADVTIWNDEDICGFTIPLTFYNPLNTDIVCDSIAWSSTFWSNEPDMAYDIKIDSAANKLMLWGVYGFNRWPTGDHLLGSIYFTTGTTWDESLSMRIDSTSFYPGIIIELSDCFGSPCTLEFIPGCYEQEPPPPPPIPAHTQWGLILIISVVAGLLGFMIIKRRRIIKNA
jgi:hypothetical protein